MFPTFSLSRKAVEPDPYFFKVVSRDTYEELDTGDSYEGRMIVEGFYDQGNGNFVLVVRSNDKVTKEPEIVGVKYDPYNTDHRG